MYNLNTCLFNIKKAALFISLITAVTIFSTGCDKKSSNSNSSLSEEVIGEAISIDTLTFNKSDDVVNSTLLFTYKDDTLQSIGGSDIFNSRDTANKAFTDYSSNTSYTDVSLDSKTVTYNYSDNGMAEYKDITEQESLINTLQQKGYIMN